MLYSLSSACPLNFDVCHGSAVDAALAVAEILHLGCLRFQHHGAAREGSCCIAQSDILSIFSIFSIQFERMRLVLQNYVCAIVWCLLVNARNIAQSGI